MEHTSVRSHLQRWRLALLALAIAAISFFAPANSYAVTSGPGVWDFMIFGNYDMVSPNTGDTFQGSTNRTWNNELNNGYGGGVGLAYWFNDMLAFRIEAQTNLYTIPTAIGGGSLQSSPLTGGLEVKLYGNPDYYLYFVVDAGAAYEANMTGQSFFGKATGNAWTAYGDAGLGLNLDFIFLEAKVAYMPQTIAHAASAQNGLWYIPLTAGFNF